ncbi:hypothetical protein [Kineosporia succinea]|uniref:Uncharacterized protein n=1 Tax=Kineosporia succinea TaxID=84632 RepID=A0ABT9NYW6_9ACTN|nr:hypothetical protein [Kineosporia succinea]MDP9825628.1 hypothetical protein [Kineosporia succinea]
MVQWIDEPAPSRWRSRAAVMADVVVAAVAGVTLGVVSGKAAASDLWGGIFTSAGLWIALITVIGLFAPSTDRAVLRTVVQMPLTVAAHLGLGPAHPPPEQTLGWCVLAAVAAPVLAGFAHEARRGGWLGSIVLACPSALLIAEARPWHSSPFGDPVAQFDLVAAAALLLLAPVPLGVRLRAALLTAPAVYGTVHLLGAAGDLVERLRP